MKRQKVQGLVLGRRPVGEADRLVTLFTRETGLMRVLAKGVRRIPSRRGGHLEPLTEVLAVVGGQPGRRYLAAVETQDYFSDLHQRTEARATGWHLATTIAGLLDEGMIEEDVFDALREAWQMLPHLEVPKQVLLEATLTWLALQRVGLKPQLEQCEKCGSTQPREAVVLQPQAGAWMCLPCHGRFAGTASSLPPRLFKALRFIARYPRKALALVLTESEAYQLRIAVRGYVTVALDNSVPAADLRFQIA